MADRRPLILSANGRLRMLPNGDTLGVAAGGTGATTAAQARTNLGLGTIATQDSGAYLPINGGTLLGPVTSTSSLAVRDVVYLGGGTSNTGDKVRVANAGTAVRIDAVDANASVFKALGFAALNYSFGGGSATFAGLVQANSLYSYSGTVGAQAPQIARGWSNGVTRWLDVIEADGSLAMYSYNASGGAATTIFNFKTPVAGGQALATFSGALTALGAITSDGSISSTGASASISFMERNDFSSKWDWYSFDGIARLWRSNFGDRMTVSYTGGLSTAGPIDAGGLTPSIGRVVLNTGGSGRTGFVSFYRSTGQRAGYIGYAAAGADRISLVPEDGIVGWNIQGDTVHSQVVYFNGGMNHLWANGASFVRVPRIFVGGGDPGAASVDGDLWIV